MSVERDRETGPELAGSANQAWGGRFSKGPAALTLEYTGSQQFDRKLYQQDIRASQAHAKMLGRQGIISHDEAGQIIAGLEQVKAEIDSGRFVWRPELEDVHMNIEARLTELIGAAGKKLHTGRSRNDQVGLTFRLHVATRCKAWQQGLRELIRTLVLLARENSETLMPGYTHMQPAQPISLAQHLLAYASMFKRDFARLEDCLARVRISPLGAAALAGSTFPLDPQFVAEEVGFPEVYANSMDAVSDRDFVLESIFAASVIMMHLSRFNEELIIWSSPAFGFVRMSDHFSTGSSIMPQKKNPDVSELMRGKTGRVYGSLLAMLTMLKGLPLAYNKDMQEDKEQFFDVDKTVTDSLEIISPMLREIRFDISRLEKACRLGYLNATELADYLAAHGLPFREAHHVTGQLVALAESLNLGLEDLSLEQMREVCPLIGTDVYDRLDYREGLKRRETVGGTGPKSIARQISMLETWLAAPVATQ